MDSSNGITSEELLQFKDFATELLKSFKISETGTHISITSFNIKPKNLLLFNGKQSAESAKNAIFNIVKKNGDANFEEVVKNLRRQVLTQHQGMRTSAKKILILFTNGDSISSNDLTGLDQTLPNIKKVVVSIEDANFNNFDEKIILDDINNLPNRFSDIEKGCWKSSP